MFCSKICLRNSYQKRTLKIGDAEIDKKQHNQILFQSAINLMFFGVIGTLGIGLFTGVGWSYMYGELNKYFIITVIMFCFASVLESASEPFLANAILNFDYDVNAKSEAASMSTRTISLFVLTKLNVLPPLTVFGIAQILSSIVLLFTARRYSSRLPQQDNVKLWPTKIQERGQEYYVNEGMKDMGKQLTIIAFLKFLLTEVEKLVLINVKTKDSVKTSAEYSLVSNVGSLVPRFLFLPIEEIALNLFGKLSEPILDEKVAKQNYQDKIQLFGKITKLINIIGLFVMAFGWNFSYAFLRLVYGDKWSEPSCVEAFKTYVIYIYIMGWNGIAEAYLYGSIKKDELNYYRSAILMSSIFYIVACVVLLQYESVGLIIANILSMLIRIVICLAYIYIHFENKRADTKELWHQIRPPMLTVGSLFFAFLIGNMIQRRYHENPLIQLLLGGGLGALTLAPTIYALRHDIKSFLKKKSG
eukprot:TRINITY_DN2372_c0_g1_i2.p1 TRINITY_DN2372_c0_g1~~TRINITY_DN2372_c0_g1_i2.p1  ORF type:complete len:473 (+),score=60.03 TRINITY_DN2372_c0_g1_i2:270-1688(+)